MYHNPLLADRVREIGVVDRFPRIGLPGAEIKLSLTITTAHCGIVLCGISLDICGADRQAVTAFSLALYPLSEQMHAQEDALLLARKWDLTLRRADPDIGWQTVRDPDVEAEKRGADLVIGS